MFCEGKADGDASMKNLLGGKGANLAEMTNLNLPVPPGFTISTEVCDYYYQHERKYPKDLKPQISAAIACMENVMGAKFGDRRDPLLVSVRSGARKSMPGMMETVLNVGLCSATIPALIEKTKNPRFVYDAYRRLIMMYADVVMEKAAGIEPHEGKGIRSQLERIIAAAKELSSYDSDVQLTVDDMKLLCDRFKVRVKTTLGKDFPDDPQEQLWGAIGAVFASWNGKRAVSYRRIEEIPDDWGTAVNVQAMVFGNTGMNSGTGVAFTRNPASGENHFYGEWLPDAQGEDVVAGIRTPNPLNESSKSEHNKELPTLEQAMPAAYKQLDAIRHKLEKHYRDTQDIEFTVEEGKLWMLQTRTGKRSGLAAMNIAMDMLEQRLITRAEAVMRVTPTQLDELLHPTVDPKAEATARPIARGLPAGPGGLAAQLVFTARDAVEAARVGRKVILVREETNPEDVEGMRAADGILTKRGGMTSHAALVARGWGKCCIVGCNELEIDVLGRRVTIKDQTFGEQDFLTLNGTRGYIYAGKLPMIDAIENPRLAEFLGYADSFRRMKVRANAENAEDAENAVKFGAEGIGLFRTEHMFYAKNAAEPLFILRKMIVAQSEVERRHALNELFPYIKADIKATLEVMAGRPVTIRLLDPPLHEFVPSHDDERLRLAHALRIPIEELNRRARVLHEVNPMMGHRGVRLGITYPEITETWVRAIFEASAELMIAGKRVQPEIMIPVVITVKELDHQKAIVDRVYTEVCAHYNLRKIDYLFGTMIEVPRAAFKAYNISEVAEFFSYGTNDLTQMGFGFSRDDVSSFMPEYLRLGILKHDPFRVLDQSGLGELIKIGIDAGRKARPNLKVGICGEHGGDPESVEFCHRIGMDYVSCSPYRIPIARLAAAQAALKEKTEATIEGSKAQRLKAQESKSSKAQESKSSKGPKPKDHR
jgi:pyruvate,orthophosphate dikinase